MGGKYKKYFIWVEKICLWELGWLGGLGRCGYAANPVIHPPTRTKKVTFSDKSVNWMHDIRRSMKRPMCSISTTTIERMKINARNATLLFEVVAMQYDLVFFRFWTRRIIENKKRKLVKGSSKVIITLFHVRKVTLEKSSWSKTVSLPNSYRLRYGIVLWSQETLA